MVPLTGGFSCLGAQTLGCSGLSKLWHVSSVIVAVRLLEHRLSSCSAWA